ncbi:response regulator transcription factor [Microbaculum marinum]|uniref:Response regulator transcription factor n=1 Tax=Microbaculum marinum TaxID=1764581 RepID=A0AAW9RYG6_9HYPH
MSALARILVVDDEAQIRRFLRVALEAHAYAVFEAATGLEAVQKAATEDPHLIVLDLGLPDIDGKAVIAKVREWSQTPILVLSVRQAEAEKVEALDAGAQDYVVKPFGIKELLARIRSLLRDRSASEDAGVHAAVAIGNLHIDVAAHEVRKDGKPLKLTRKEFDVLWTLARHAGRIVTHKALLREVWGKAHEHDTQYLRVFIRQLRRKLDDDPASPRYIMNEPGVGYRLLEP